MKIHYILAASLLVLTFSCTKDNPDPRPDNDAEAVVDGGNEGEGQGEGGEGGEGGGQGEGGDQGGGQGEGGDQGGSSTGGDAAATLQYLGGYEIPAINLADTEKCYQSGDQYGPWWNYQTGNENQMVITHAYTYNGKQYRNWTALIDGTKKAPLWSAFIMHREAYPMILSGRGSWSQDKGIPADWQQCAASRESGRLYARGHLVASSYRQTTNNANDQTFLYTNQAYQEQDRFNGWIWEALENAVKSNAPSGRDSLYVVVGLLYEDDRTMNNVPCPSHFYKLLMKCGFNTDGSMKSAQGVAYLMENHEHEDKVYNKSAYLTSIDAIEQRSGFNFFVNIPQEFQDAAEAMTTPLF